MATFAVFAQKITRVELMQSETFIGLKRNGENTNKVIKPVFKQDNILKIDRDVQTVQS